ncbi:hypothetical protein PXJ20_32090 [Paraburkholderia sp. A1RI_3L]|uniref:hypothetical protein n=1 Tax=Paraburkholderia TaxID=1822464 RepID=UPI003B7DA8FF
MKTTTTLTKAITSPLAGTEVWFDPNGLPFINNENAVCLMWTPRRCCVRLR